MRKYMLAAIAASVLLVQCSKKDVAPNTTDTGLNNKSVGASANDFLSASKYSSINLQLQYMPGYAPDADALASLVAFLNMYVNKPSGINITQTAVAASGKASFSQADLNALEAAGRTQFTAGNVLSVYVVFVDAPFTTANVLGVAYKNTSLAIFGPTVMSNSGGVNQTTRTKLETTVEEHEFGHLLGLVNTGSPMVTAHEDANHPAHCNNTACLMYYATQTSVMGGILLNSPVPMLDANCKADLHGNGGR